MKQIVSALAFVLIILAPLFAQGETSSSADSSGNASAAAVATDENGSSISTSGENASITISVEEPSFVVTTADSTIGIGENKTIEPIPSSNESVKSISDENKAACNVSAERIDDLTGALKDFSPVSDRTVKILKLLAVSIIAIAIVLALQIIILVRLSQRRSRTTRIEEGLNKF